MKFVVVKGTFGLGGRISIFLSAYAYAQKTGRTLVVDWNDYTYYDKSIKDCYSHLFDKPKVMSITEFDPKNKTIFPKCWTKANIKGDGNRYCTPPKTDVKEDIVVISRDNPSIYYKHLYKLLVPSKCIMDEIEAYKKKFFTKQRVVGIHIRSGNGEPGVTQQNTNKFHHKLSGIKFTKIFLATDSPQVLNEFRKKYGEKLLTFPKKYPKAGNGCFHRTTDKLNRVRVGEEAVIDMWLLKNCDEIILTDGRYFDYTVFCIR